QVVKKYQLLPEREGSVRLGRIYPEELSNLRAPFPGPRSRIKLEYADPAGRLHEAQTGFAFLEIFFFRHAAVAFMSRSGWSLRRAWREAWPTRRGGEGG